jgi:hypothetical protein
MLLKTGPGDQTPSKVSLVLHLNSFFLFIPSTDQNVRSLPMQTIWILATPMIKNQRSSLTYHRAGMWGSIRSSKTFISFLALARFDGRQTLQGCQVLKHHVLDALLSRITRSGHNQGILCWLFGPLGGGTFTLPFVPSILMTTCVTAKYEPCHHSL